MAAKWKELKWPTYAMWAKYARDAGNPDLTYDEWQAQQGANPQATPGSTPATGGVISGIPGVNSGQQITWRVPSADPDWGGASWADLLSFLKSGVISERALRDLIAKYPPQADGQPLGAQVIEGKITDNKPTRKTSALADAFPVVQNPNTGEYYILDARSGGKVATYANSSLATYARDNGKNVGNKFVPADIPPDFKPPADEFTDEDRKALIAAGFNADMDEADIVQRAVDQRATPEDAWRALQVLKGYSPERATEVLQGVDKRWQPPAHLVAGLDINATARPAPTGGLTDIPNAGQTPGVQNVPVAQMPSGLTDLQQQAWNIAVQAGIPPQSFLGLIGGESGWNPQAVNPSSGAAGLGQFLPSTAAGYGVTPEQLRNDPQLALTLAAQYLANSYQMQGSDDWAKAFAAYFIGDGNIQKAQQLAAQNGTNWLTEANKIALQYGQGDISAFLTGHGIADANGNISGAGGTGSGFGQTAFGQAQQTQIEQIKERFRLGEISEAQMNAQIAAIKANDEATAAARQRQALDAARAQFEAQGYRVFGGADGTLRVETPDNHVFTAGVDANGQIVTSAPQIRQTGLGGSNSPESMLPILMSPAFRNNPDLGEAYKTLAPTRPTTDALFNAMLFNQNQQNYQTAPGNQKITVDDLIAKGMSPADAAQTVALRGIADRNATAEAQALANKLNIGQGAAPSTSTNPTQPQGGFQVSGNRVLNRFGQIVDQNGDPITDEDMYAPSAFADDPNRQLSRVLSLSRAAFAEGGTISMGNNASLQERNGRPALTLNEPASIIGDITGKRYGVIGETGKRETLMPGPNGMRIEPTGQDMVGFAEGGTVQAGGGITVTGVLPDGSILIRTSLGQQQVISPDSFALLSTTQRNEIERQVQQMALNNQQEQVAQEQAAAEEQARQEAARAAQEAAQRDQLNTEQRILDARLQEYEHGSTGLDQRAALAGVQAPLTQSQYLQNFTLPQVQLRGGQNVLNAQGVPQRYGSKLFPLLTQNASGQTSTLGRSLRQQYRANNPTSRTRPSLLRLQVR